MNCESVRNLIYLNDSGELGAVGRRRLRAHLRSCPDCRAAADALVALRRTVRAAAPDPDLSPIVLEPILRAGRVEMQRTGATPARISPVLSSGWTRAMALAAAVMFAVLVGLQGRNPGRVESSGAVTLQSAGWNDRMDVELDAMGLEVKGLMADLDSNEDVDRMVQELMQLEGEES